MFYTLLIIASLAYSIQQLLLVKYIRRLDGTTVSIFRNLSLSITLIPLLFFCTYNEIIQAKEFIIEFIIAGFCGAAFLRLFFNSFKYIPISIATNTVISFRTIILLILGYTFLNESMSYEKIVIIILIIIGNIYISLIKNHLPHLINKIEKGFALTFLGAFFLSICIFFLTKASRVLNPLVAGYFWETSIGIAALILGLITSAIPKIKYKFKTISLSDFFKILLAASPTAIGTSCFSLALTYGPIAEASAINSIGTIFTIILSYIFLNEKLTKLQIGLIIFITILIGILRLI